MMWGSFPCQDLSLAGAGAGLKGERSGTFYAFWDLIRGLIQDGRAPRMVAVENVCGALTSHGGQDFEAICRTFAEAGYRYGALVINADLFVPQSRPRLFVIGVRADVEVAPDLAVARTDRALPHPRPAPGGGRPARRGARAPAVVERADARAPHRHLRRHHRGAPRPASPGIPWRRRESCST